MGNKTISEDLGKLQAINPVFQNIKPVVVCKVFIRNSILQLILLKSSRIATYKQEPANYTYSNDKGCTNVWICKIKIIKESKTGNL